MNYKSFNLGDWIGHISGVIEDETTLDGNEMRDLVEFLSTLKQERFINKPCVSSGVCEYNKNKVLDNIRAEIEQLTIVEGGDDYVRKMAELFTLKMKVLQIIDKYKAETEG